MLLYMVIHKSSTENHWMYNLMWQNGQKKIFVVVECMRILGWDFVE